ncbi:MAG TPA: COX15/CtaA family protein [Myxococcota bacterium]|nr:COX15/CtaA family protein [Myxococcota bacterium]
MVRISDDGRRTARRAGRAAAALAFCAWALIAVGALVRANGAGLSCPDWPLCTGRLVPSFDARVALEWGHRLLAGSLSLGIAALAVAIAARRELRARFGPRLVLLFALLGTQVVLGGLTVLLGLAPWTVTAHLCTGNLLALALAWLARDLLDAAGAREPARSRLTAPGARLLWIVAGLVGLQIALGGLVSSHSAGLACAAFPTCDGDSLVPSVRGLVGLHVIHRLNAYAVALGCSLLAWMLRNAGPVARLAWTALRLVLVQIAVGAANVLLQLPVELTALHSALAAAIALSVGLALRESLLSARATQESVAPGAVERHALGGAR